MKIAVDPKTGKIVFSNTFKPLQSPKQNLTVLLDLETLEHLAQIIGKIISQEIINLLDKMPQKEINYSKSISTKQVEIDKTTIDVNKEDLQPLKKPSRGKLAIEKIENDSSIKQSLDKLKALKED